MGYRSFDKTKLKKQVAFCEALMESLKDLISENATTNIDTFSMPNKHQAEQDIVRLRRELQRLPALMSGTWDAN